MGYILFLSLQLRSRIELLGDTVMNLVYYCMWGKKISSGNRVFGEKKFLVETESLRLDFLWNGFFCKYLRRGNRVLKTRFMELEFQRLEFHLSGIVRK